MTKPIVAFRSFANAPERNASLKKLEREGADRIHVVRGNLNSAGFCEYGNETSGSVTCGLFLG